MKTTRRDNLLSDGTYDSDADHTWLMCMMMLVFYPKLQTKVDLGHALMVATVHDLAEAKTGDVPLSDSINDKNVRADKSLAETKAMQEIVALLPEDSRSTVYDLWQEYEDNKTPEAKFAKAIDKLEAGFQALQYEDIRYWERYGDGKIYYEIVLNDMKKPHWQHEPALTEFGDRLKKLTAQKMRDAELNPDDYLK
jgi:5'-deoxynucleotidase YfbR-like HD superfamily hydrolase